MIPNTCTSTEGVSITDFAITPKTFESLSDANSVTIENCTSHSWRRIGEALASLKKLLILKLRNCNIVDGRFYESLSKSHSLRSLEICTPVSNSAKCKITGEGAQSIIWMRHLEELTLLGIHTPRLYRLRRHFDPVPYQPDTQETERPPVSEVAAL